MCFRSAFTVSSINRKRSSACKNYCSLKLCFIQYLLKILLVDMILQLDYKFFRLKAFSTSCCFQSKCNPADDANKLTYKISSRKSQQQQPCDELSRNIFIRFLHFKPTFCQLLLNQREIDFVKEAFCKICLVRFRFSYTYL